MAVRKYLFFLILSLCSLHFLTVSAASMQYENQVIARLDIEVANASADCALEAAPIKARMSTKEGGLFYQAEFDNDLKTLIHEFDRIEPILECVDGKMYITLKIWPKPVIRTIIWEGNCKIATQDLVSELGVSSCSVFDRLAFNKAFHKLKTYYVTHGFFEAELNYTVSPDPHSNQVDIIIHVKEGRAGRIKKIVFRNFCQDEIDELAEMFVTKPYNIFLSWLNDEGTYREDAVRQDEFLALNYLQDKGFADARVRIEVREAKDDCLIIAVIAERGEPYSIGKVCISGHTLFSEDEIRCALHLNEGDTYAPDVLRAAAMRLTNLYGKYGYIDAIIDYTPKLVCNQYAYDVDFTIEEGEQFRVGLIKVMGNCSTQTSVILHETLLIPGEIFNLGKMKRTEDRLTNIGYFKCVNVYTVKSDECSTLGGNYRDVIIEVEETTTGQFSLSFGLSTVEDIFGTLALTERNFNIEGITNVWSQGLCALRGGGEFLNISTTIGSKSRSYQFSWTKPYFMDSQWTVGVDFESTVNRYIAKDYDINSTGMTLRAAYQANAFVKTVYHYRLKKTHIIADLDHLYHERHEHKKKALEATTKKEQDAWSAKEAQDQHHIDQLEKDIKLSGTISAIGGAWIYDSTNNPYKPCRGWKSRFEGEFVGIFGDHVFLSVGYLNAYYFQLPSIDTKGVWKLRADMRFLQPIGGTMHDDIPIDERYFLGGPYQIRGYRPYRIGPSYKSGDPEGGISLQLYSAEYSRVLGKSVEGFLFFDAGHLSDRQWHFGRLFTSAGFGVRIGLLPGSPPFVFGLGFPLNAHDRHQVKRFFFELGGQF